MSQLLDEVRNTLRVHHYAMKTEKSYVQWIKRFILFHNKRHPAKMGKLEVEQFLTWLAVVRKVAPSTQNQALQAILFLYKKVLDVELAWLNDVVRAKSQRRIPVVLSRREVAAVLAALPSQYQLIGKLLYGICHASFRIRYGYSNHPGLVGPQGSLHNNDLYTRG